MITSKTMLATALAFGAVTLFSHDVAEAQRIRDAERQRARDNPAQAQQQGQATIQGLTREESAGIVPFYQAVTASDWATAGTTLAAAQAAAQSPAARYLVGQLQYQMGQGTQNAQTQSQAVDAMLASGAVPADNLNPLLNAQANFAIESNNFAAAEAPLTRLLEADPNNAQRITTLGQVKLRLNKNDEAMALFRRALELSSANGQAAPEDQYRRVLALAYQARQAQPSIELSRQLVQAYPTPTNWRDALMIYREFNNIEGPAAIDFFRLQRAAGALNGEADYVTFADELNRAGLPGEAKAVLDEGVSRRALTGSAHTALLGTVNGLVAEDRAGLAGQRAAALAAPEARRTIALADAHSGYGQYAEAAELYRAGLGKSGADADLVNLRLGAALAQAGQRAEAETALRAVTGARQPLANYWLLWLARRPA